MPDPLFGKDWTLNKDMSILGLGSHDPGSRDKEIRGAAK